MNNQQSLRQYFTKLIDKALTQGEPLNHYLVMRERHWMSDWYRQLFPHRIMVHRPYGVRYEDGELIVTTEKDIRMV
jgi:hypothetical protein